MFKNKIYSLEKKKIRQCKLRFVLQVATCMFPKSVFGRIPDMQFLIAVPHTSGPSYFKVPFNGNSHMLLEVLLLLKCHKHSLVYFPSAGNSVTKLT